MKEPREAAEQHQPVKSRFENLPVPTTPPPPPRVPQVSPVTWRHTHTRGGTPVLTRAVTRHLAFVLFMAHRYTKEQMEGGCVGGGQVHHRSLVSAGWSRHFGRARERGGRENGEGEMEM